jgi:predicted PurR-regulated permease PerM
MQISPLMDVKDFQNPGGSNSNDPSMENRVSFTGKASVVMLLAILFGLVIIIFMLSIQVLMIIFASTLLAVILRTSANALSRWTGMNVNWALSLVLLLIVVTIVMAGWFAAPRIVTEMGELRVNLSRSVDTLADKFAELPGEENLADRGEQIRENLANGGKLWRRVGGVFSTTFGAIGSFLVFVFAGLFFAYNPNLYLSGLLRLFPPSRRNRASEVLTSLGDTLRGWLVGQLISMTILFLTTWIMLSLLGVPLAFILALMTGVLTFVPYIGPLLAAIPILLVAFIVSPMTALYTALLYLLIQNVEGNVIMPLVFQKTVHLPPVLSIAGTLILGGILGVSGFILATPLTAVGMVLIQKFYIEDVLGDSLEDYVAILPRLRKNPA